MEILDSKELENVNGGSELSDAVWYGVGYAAGATVSYFEDLSWSIRRSFRND